jgi:hypothetical protein
MPCIVLTLGPFELIYFFSLSIKLNYKRHVNTCCLPAPTMFQIFVGQIKKFSLFLPSLVSALMNERYILFEFPIVKSIFELREYTAIHRPAISLFTVLALNERLRPSPLHSSFAAHPMSPCSIHFTVILLEAAIPKSRQAPLL